MPARTVGASSTKRLVILWSLKDMVDGAPRRLTTAAEFESYPTWSRDGRSIAYVAWDDDKAGRIKVASATGGDGRDRDAGARPLCRTGLLA